MAPAINTKIMSKFDGKIYKQDTYEVELIKTIIEKIIISNNLETLIDQN